jgi:DNA adenine methylase
MNKVNFEPIIKWSGSKRLLAPTIVNLFPDGFERYFEPFLGGGAVMYSVRGPKRVCSDINEPLVELWKTIRNNPAQLVHHYSKHWAMLNASDNSEAYRTYYKVRERFNKSFRPEDLLFLSRTCVNGLIRFNRQGQFNNSLHYTRKGINPMSLEKVVHDWSAVIQDVDFFARDYRWILDAVTKSDLVYLDPPYFNTKGRYYGTIDHNEFISFLRELNRKGVRYMLSFDGKAGARNYMVELPDDLYTHHYLVASGNSTFNKVIDKTTISVSESIYTNYTPPAQASSVIQLHHSRR